MIYQDAVRSIEISAAQCEVLHTSKVKLDGNYHLANKFRRGRRHTFNLPSGRFSCESVTEARESFASDARVRRFLAPGERHARDTPLDSRGAHLRRACVHLRNRPRRAAVSIWRATLAARSIR